MNYQTVIGLEVHVQLKSATKIFCSCPVGWGGEPNTRVCPVCLGLPGTLPVLNRHVLELAARAAVALGSSISSFSKFDRKNYYYPDLPKNFQISQFDRPLALNGSVDIRVDGKKKTVGITRAHLEEDAGKLVHFEEGGFSGVDYNRTGVPLLEIVSDPDLRSPEEAYEYLKTLRALMRWIGISDCDMEKGSFRCDANISLRSAGTEGLGVKTEVKNMNSFRGVERALSYEVERQARILGEGGTIVQETRLYNDDSQKTYSMRSKEEAHDYRYFPEPDLPPVVLEEEWIKEIRNSLPELPESRAARFRRDYGLPEYDTSVLTAEKDISDFFEKAVRTHPNYKVVSNWISVELLGLLNKDNISIENSPVKPEGIAGLVEIIDEGQISNKIGKKLLKIMYDRSEAQVMLNKDAILAIIENEGLKQISDSGQLEEIVDRVIEENPEPVADFRSGTTKAIGFLVGQVMKATRGKANPKMVNQILQKKLK